MIDILPELVYRCLVGYLKHRDKLFLRLTSRRLYENSIWDPTFKVWTFHISKGAPPNFVLESDKKICVLVNKVSDYHFLPGLAYKHASRLLQIHIKLPVRTAILLFEELSKLKPEFDSVQWLNLDCSQGQLFWMGKKSMKPLPFPNLKALTLDHCKIDGGILVMLAPNLNTLKLYDVKGFDISQLDECSTAFSRLTKLSLVECDVDVAKMLAKVCGTLKYLELDGYRWLRIEQLQNCKFPFLESVHIREGPCRNVVEFVALIANSVVNLELFNLRKNMDFDLLKNVRMPNLRVLELVHFWRAKNVGNFLRNSPLLQNLTFECPKITLNDVILSSQRLTLNKITYLSVKGLYGSDQTGFLLPLKLLRASQMNLRKLYIQLSNTSCPNSTLPCIPTLEEATILCNSLLPSFIRNLNYFLTLFSGQVEVTLVEFNPFKYKYKRIFNLTAADENIDHGTAETIENRKSCTVSHKINEVFNIATDINNHQLEEAPKKKMKLTDQV